MFSFKAVYSLAPPYLSEYLKPRQHFGALHSSEQSLLEVPLNYFKQVVTVDYGTPYHLIYNLLIT